jgi:protein-disulfide isomerase
MHPANKLSYYLAIIMSIAPVSVAQTKPSRQPVAQIGDQAIYEEDLLPSIGGQMLQLKNQEYDLKIKAIDSLINQRLLEAAAKDAGLSTEAFLEQTVDRNLPPWNIGELDGYYLAQRDRLNKPLEEVRPQLEQAFIQAKRQKARQEYIEGLRQKAGIAVLLGRPKVEVAADPSRLRGNPDAPVTIVEFADFQCPYCQDVEKTVKAVMERYQGKVKLGFRDFPLRQIHPQAQPAAEASRCAGEQGKFWEYHDLLYASQSRLDPTGLADNARAAGLDVDRFGACQASGKFRSQIESDLQSGTAAGTTGTPAFYINGVLLSGSQPVSAFEKIIDSELAQVQVKSQKP